MMAKVQWSDDCHRCKGMRQTAPMSDRLNSGNRVRRRSHPQGPHSVKFSVPPRTPAPPLTVSGGTIKMLS